MEQSHFFAVLFRMRYINRWGLMHNTREENISEHSLDVAVLAHALAVLRNRRFGGNTDPEQQKTLPMQRQQRLLPVQRQQRLLL